MASAMPCKAGLYLLQRQADGLGVQWRGAPLQGGYPQSLLLLQGRSRLLLEREAACGLLLLLQGRSRLLLERETSRRLLQLLQGDAACRLLQ